MADDFAAEVTSAWRRVDGWLGKNRRRVPGLDARATSAMIAKAREAKLPPSLCALHAAHDGGEDVELLGIGRVFWWSLRDIIRNGATDYEGRELFVFATPLDDELAEVVADGERPLPDDELETLFAVDAASGELVSIGLKGSFEIVAPSLATPLARIAAELEGGTRTLDENGRLAAVERKAAARASAAAAAPASSSGAGAGAAASAQLEAFTAKLLERKMVELREGASPSELSAAFASALKVEEPKAKRRAVFEIFESDLVDEVYIDDDELEDLAKLIARQFG